MANIDVDTVNDIDKTLSIDCQICDQLEKCRDILTNLYNFRILSLNIRSIRKNFDKFLVAFQRLNLNIDIVVLTECWLGSDPPIGQIPGYNSYSTKNIQNKSGGVVVYVRDTWSATVTEPEFKESECLKIDLSDTVVVFAIYRSPSFKNTEKFCNSLSQAIEEIKNDVSIIVAGDANINIISPLDEVASEYLCMMTELNLQAAITEPTREDSCLDHIFIRTKAQDVIGVIGKTDVTDHSIVALGVTLKSAAPKQHRDRSILKTDYKAVARELQQTDWSSFLELQNVNDAVEEFDNTITLIINRHTCKKRLARSQFALKPWITPGLIRCMRHRDKLHAESKKHPDDSTCKLIYRRYRNFFNDLLHKLKRDHERRENEANKNCPKSLWKSIKTIIDVPRKQTSALELLKCKPNSQDSANHCNQYFANVGAQLASKLLQSQNKTEAELAADSNNYCEHSEFPDSFFLQPTDEVEVGKLIDRLKRDSAPGLDGIKPALVKAIKMEILVPLTHIFNISLSTATFPHKWKLASVTPIYKGGPKNLPENYRPISLLATFSKILERIVNHRLVTFLEKRNLLSNQQYGFRRGKSTEHAVELMVRKVTSSLDKRQKCIGVFLDLAKAFDTISVTILFKKLKRLGIRGLPLKWFQSYLGQRNQCIKIGDSFSDTLPIHFGVPQGSVLGPTFFILYMNDIHTACHAKSDLICYADDTVALFYGRTWESVFHNAEIGMARIKQWLDSNLLTLNLSKTKYLCFRMTKKLEPDPRLCLKIHSACMTSSCDCGVIARSPSIRYLGIIVDELLSFKEHITALGRRTRKIIHIMKSLRNAACERVLRLVYVSLCESVLSHCITVWGGAGCTAMLEVERAQRAVLKVMCKLPYRHPTNDLYATVGVPTVRQLYIQKVALAVHQTMSCPASSSSPRRRPLGATLPNVKTAFAQRFPDFRFPFIYNKVDKKCDIRGKRVWDCKAILNKYLGTLSYDETENFLKIVT